MPVLDLGGPRPAARRTRWAALVLILLLAAFLRFHHLDAQSLWYDEGNSARIVERSPQLIIEAAAGDIHPPGYYLALAGWRLLAGFSAFGLRSFSAFCGLLTVALTYAIGRRLLAWRPAPDDPSRAPVRNHAPAVGALLAAVHAFQVYYSQEARMYAMLAAVAAAAMYALIRWLDDTDGRAWGWLAAWVLLNALGLYTQYVYPAVMLVQGAAFIVWWLHRGRPRRALARYVLGNAAALLLFLPWLPVALRQINTWPTGGGGVPFIEALAGVSALLTFGGAPVAGPLDSLAVLAPLLLLGAAIRPSRGRGVLGLLALWALLAPLGMLALGLYREAFLKMLLVGHAPLLLLMAWGLAGRNPIARIWRPFQWALALGVGLGLLSGLVQLGEPENLRADYRAMAAYIAAQAGPDDAVLLNAANQWEVFTYYYREGVPVYPLPRQRPVDAEAVRAELEAILARHRRLYVLYWGDAESDPARVVEGYLNAQAFELGTTWYRDVRLVSYALPPDPASEPVAGSQDMDARFGDALRLAGYTLHAPDPLCVGCALALTLDWQAEAVPAARYKVFVHLISDETGQVVAQHDAEPGGASQPPTDAWPPGAQVTDRHGLAIPTDAPPGTYRLVVGVYAIGEPTARLPLTVGGAPAGDMLTLAELRLP